jgi:putative SOS response-associated peptidase YedK
MCGRVFLKAGAAELIEKFSFASGGAREALGNLAATYNGAPGQDFAIIVKESDMPGARFMWARWGLIPSWVKEAKPKVKPINAKAEGIATNGMFRGAYQSRRALMPVNGYFEWQGVKGTKQPYAIAMENDAPFALAAIWEKWRNPESGEDVTTFAIVTCPANELMSRIHDRMPVIIAAEDYIRWLGEEVDPRDLLKPFPSAKMKMRPVSPRVNSYKNNDPSLLESQG